MLGLGLGRARLITDLVIRPAQKENIHDRTVDCHTHQQLATPAKQFEEVYTMTTTPNMTSKIDYMMTNGAMNQ